MTYIYIYIYTDTNPITLPCSLARAGNKHVVMLGGLHIETAIWNTLGDYLDSSGWTIALHQAGVASSGTADSFLSAAHLTRTRHGHQVSALTLSKLQHNAFLSNEGFHDEEKEAWRQQMVEKIPTFHFWDTVLRMELMGLIFVRAHRGILCSEWS